MNQPGRYSFYEDGKLLSKKFAEISKNEEVLITSSAINFSSFAEARNSLTLFLELFYQEQEVTEQKAFWT